VFVGVGLLYLQYHPSQRDLWAQEQTAYHSWWPFTLAYIIGCLFLVIAPFIPNDLFFKDDIPYYVFPTVSCCALILGFLYWVGFAKLLLIFGFAIEVERMEDEHGNEVIKYKASFPSFNFSLFHYFLVVSI
jgi:hypothetical protein